MASKSLCKNVGNYWFDNFMSRGTVALMAGLGGLSALHFDRWGNCCVGRRGFGATRVWQWDDFHRSIMYS